MHRDAIFIIPETGRPGFCILGVPRLPLPQLLPSALLARNLDRQILSPLHFLSPTLPPLLPFLPLYPPPLPSPLPVLHNAPLLSFRFLSELYRLPALFL